MKHLSLLSIFLLAGSTFFACKEKPKDIYFDTSYTSESNNLAETDTSATTVTYVPEQLGNEVSIPYREQNGVKVVSVRVNGMPLDMIFDTGASLSLISQAEAQYLYQKGLLTKDDILGSTQAQIADGSIVEDMVINLREVVLGDAIHCSNVQATVSNNINAPLLLGNSVLNRAPAYTIDNTNQQIVFHLQ